MMIIILYRTLHPLAEQSALSANEERALRLLNVRKVETQRDRERPTDRQTDMQTNVCLHAHCLRPYSSAFRTAEMSGQSSNAPVLPAHHSFRALPIL